MTQMVDRVDLVRNRCVHLCAWRAKVVLLPKLTHAMRWGWILVNGENGNSLLSDYLSINGATMSCLRVARTMRDFLLTLSSFYKSIICLLFCCTDYTIISPFLEAMPETVSPEQLLGRGEVVVKIFSIGTLPSPAMIVSRGHGHICPAT